MLRCALSLALTLATVSFSAQERQTYGVGTDGRKLYSLAAPGTKAIVLFFVATDCPISNDLGVIEARTGDLTAARRDLEHALRLEPGNEAVRANLRKF